MVQAVIFDLDGTVLDNEGEWEEAFRQIADKYQIPNHKLQLMPNGWIHEPGIGIKQDWKQLVEGDFDRIEKLSRETYLTYRKNMGEEHEPNIRPGAEETIAEVKQRGWQTALSTGSNWFVAEKELEQLGLYLAFDVTTTGEEVMLLKPDPEIYLLTAQKLGVEPEECLVIEDAVAGVRAGVEAGMKVIGLESDYAPKELLLSAGAANTAKDFEEVKELLSKWDNKDKVDL